MDKLTGSLRIGLAVALVGLAAQPAQAQRLSGEAVIDALEDGGYTIVMRHAPASLEAARNSGGGGGRGGFGGGGGRGGRGGGEPPPEPTEEALEQTSVEMLTGMRYAIWHFQIPIGAIYASPTRRTREHAEELPFVDIEIVDELSLDAAGSGWLARKLREAPMAGSNTIIVTHSPNIEADLGLDGVAEGEALIVQPGANPTVVGRLTLREWSALATESSGG
jgi:hypothetical protein